MTTTAHWRRYAGSAALVLSLVAGCGGEEPQPSAADQVPALSTQLERIDTALAAKRYERARDLLEQLTRTTIEARESGDLDGATADRVLAAASRLLAALPEPEPEPVPTTTVTAPAPPANDDEDGDEGRGDDKKLEEDLKKLEEERKKLEEERKKAEEERGDD